MPLTKERTNVYEIVTEKVIAALEGGAVPWHKPWNVESGLPRNLASGKFYRGINVFLLGYTAMIEGYTAPWWLTYRQAEERGGHVRKGEKSTLITFWKQLEPREEVTEKTGKTVKRTPVVLRYFNVFNVEQCETVPYPKSEDTAHQWDALAEAETIAKGYLAHGPTLRHGGSRAFYSPPEDRIQLPAKTSFADRHRYYSTLFHEMTHSTGHTSRLNREGVSAPHIFGSPDYSQEELVAEMGAALLCGACRIEESTIPQSAAYIQSWLKVLRGDSKLVVKAAAQAQKAADLIQGVTFEGEGEKGK